MSDFKLKIVGFNKWFGGKLNWVYVLSNIDF